MSSGYVPRIFRVSSECLTISNRRGLPDVPPDIPPDVPPDIPPDRQPPHLRSATPPRNEKTEKIAWNSRKSDAVRPIACSMHRFSGAHLHATTHSRAGQQ
ncbi:hypothetical protein BASA62_009877 [Batrachochytrium salamandrivorans]|nr:hypothetical protein BASA62_009877 [Batrachochytrium salamandrivorans]